MSQNTFGDLVKRERSKQEISLAKLAEQMGGEINPSYINRLEKGEKENPGFRVVLGLCKALNLNISEVFQSFGFGSLVTHSDQNNEFSIEDLIRLHNILIPSANIHEGIIAHEQQNYLYHSEKEELIRVIYTILDYAFGEDASVDKLALTMKQVDKLRKAHQKAYAKKEKFEICVTELTYTVELEYSLKKWIGDIGVWKEAVKQEFKKLDSKLRDYESGVFSIQILGKEYVIQKDRTNIKILYQQNKIIPL